MDPSRLPWCWQGELVMEREQEIQAGSGSHTSCSTSLPAAGAWVCSRVPELCLCCALGCREDDPPSPPALMIFSNSNTPVLFPAPRSPGGVTFLVAAFPGCGPGCGGSDPPARPAPGCSGLS